MLFLACQCTSWSEGDVVTFRCWRWHLGHSCTVEACTIYCFIEYTPAAMRFSAGSSSQTSIVWSPYTTSCVLTSTTAPLFATIFLLLKRRKPGVQRLVSSARRILTLTVRLFHSYLLFFYHLLHHMLGERRTPRYLLQMYLTPTFSLSCHACAP